MIYNNGVLSPGEGFHLRHTLTDTVYEGSIYIPPALPHQDEFDEITREEYDRLTAADEKEVVTIDEYNALLERVRQLEQMQVGWEFDAFGNTTD